MTHDRPSPAQIVAWLRHGLWPPSGMGAVADMITELIDNLHAVEAERDDAQSEILVLRDEIGRLRAEALDAYGRGLMRAGRGSGE